MNPKRIVCYDSGDDSLTFIKDGSGDRTINAGLTLITLNKKNEITAFELMGAHKNFKIPKEVLGGIRRAKVDFTFNKEKKVLIINILLLYKRKQKDIITIAEDLTRFKNLIMDNQSMLATACS